MAPNKVGVLSTSASGLFYNVISQLPIRLMIMSVSVSIFFMTRKTKTPILFSFSVVSA